ncbi:MAG: hypothetical protein KIT11_11040 [Fimbriimonadaceae bacterium]|nr:hypothetical protein [Fimbriimonadaceae bacterium]QYK55856.1 MAG: hypothetical protein KF733_12710 [Fimbriimonadaceae bacterium]
MRTRKTTLIALALLGGVLVTPCLASAQDQDVRNQIVPVLELDQADVRDALKVIFRAVNASYSVRQDVQGTVTVSLRDVPFETALRNVLNQVQATYSIEGGVYVIFPRPTSTIDAGANESEITAPAEQTSPVVKIRVRNADPALITAILAGNADILTPPEQSTASGLGSSGSGSGLGGGGGFGGGGFGGGGFGGGGFGGGGFGGGGFSGGGGGGFGGGGFGGGGGGGLGR